MLSVLPTVMNRRAHAHRLRPAALAAAGISIVLLPACASRGPQVVAPYAMRDRVERVEVGQSLAEVRAILGRDPVRKPNHPEAPFASPLQALDLRAPDGRAVRLETYVVAARPVDGCPDFQYEDVPILYVDGAVAYKGWGAVEWTWRDWGGSLAALREVQDRLRCSDEAGG
jgi:hypothetical protein